MAPVSYWCAAHQARMPEGPRNARERRMLDRRRHDVSGGSSGKTKKRCSEAQRGSWHDRVRAAALLIDFACRVAKRKKRGSWRLEFGTLRTRRSGANPFSQATPAKASRGVGAEKRENGGSGWVCGHIASASSSGRGCRAAGTREIIGEPLAEVAGPGFPPA